MTKLPLEPLPAVHIHHLIQARLGVDVIPEPLTQQVAEKAEGNRFLLRRSSTTSVSGV